MANPSGMSVGDGGGRIGPRQHAGGLAHDADRLPGASLKTPLLVHLSTHSF